MRDNLIARRGPPPQPQCWPVWAWYQKDGERDARQVPLERGADYSNIVRLHLQLDDTRVLLSNFDVWSIVHNCAPIVDNDDEAEAFWARAAALGLPTAPLSYDELDEILAHPELGPELRQSWQKVFDLQRHIPEWTSEPAERSIQAVFWEITAGDVIDVEQL